jgi:hypothetical protein
MPIILSASPCLATGDKKMPQLIQGTALAGPGFIGGWLGQIIGSEKLLKYQML